MNYTASLDQSLLYATEAVRLFNCVWSSLCDYGNYFLVMRCDEIVDLFEDVPNGRKLQRGTVQYSAQDPQFVILDTFSQSIAASYDC